MEEIIMQYIAIIGDIVDSRKLEDRFRTQEQLRVVLESINRKYDPYIESRFTITLGDEFEGLLKVESAPVEIIKEIQKHLYPVNIRFGIGIGEMSTSIYHDVAIGADGPAYYGARSVIDELKKREKKEKNKTPDIQLCLYGKEEFAVRQINAFFSMIRLIENTWSWTQRITIWDMHDIGGSQAECAKRLGVSQPTVQRRLETGNYNLYFQLLEVVEESINRLGKENV
jgi:hypothetical protein